VSLLLLFGGAPPGGLPQTIDLSSIASTESVPNPGIAGGSFTQTVAMSSIASAESVGLPNVAIRQTIEIGSVANAPVVGAPSFTLPAAPAPDLRLVVRVMDRDDVLVERVELDERLAGSTFQRLRKAAGIGNVTLLNDDPDLALARYGDFLRFELDGEARFLSIIEKKTADTIRQGEEAEQVTTLSGRGHLAVFEDALVHPESLDGTLPVSDTRVFNFASGDLDVTGWSAVTTGALGSALQADPEGWPDPAALRIWAGHPVYAGFAPAGDSYLRPTATFTIPVTGTYRLFYTFDDGGEVWIDNVFVGGETRPYLWKETKQVDVFLVAGEHTIALKGTNLERPGLEESNTAWALASLFALREGGTALGDVIVRTDATWIGLGYPPAPPGFTAGRVIRILLEEAQARGALLTVELAFDDLTDSAGLGWEVSPDFAFRIGDDLLMVLEQIAEAHLDELKMAPAVLRLYAYRSAGQVTAASLHAPTDPDDPNTGNLLELTHEGTI
jgi:hypothetical protein